MKNIIFFFINNHFAFIETAFTLYRHLISPLSLSLLYPIKLTTLRRGNDETRLLLLSNLTMKDDEDHYNHMFSFIIQGREGRGAKAMM